VRRRLGPNAVVLLAYAAVSFVYFGTQLVSHPGRVMVGAANISDSHLFIWSFAWWPHAILHGLNPFYSRLIYAPTGINLTQVTSVPGLAIAFSPVTLLFGPVVGFNVAAIVLPAVTAWSAYLLCRYVTGSTWAAVVGGYLYGFSSFILAHEQVGHLNHISAFVTPLVALCVLRFLRGDLGKRGLVWRVGVLVAFQAYTSTENSITLTFMLAVALALGAVLVREARPLIRSALVPLLSGYALAGVLAAPILYYSLTGFNRATVYADIFKIDLLNILVPTRVIGLGGTTFDALDARLTGAPTERTLYLGLPILLILGLTVWRLRTPAVRFLVSVFAVATFLSLGDGLYVLGHRVVRLPWSVVEHWTGFDDIVTARFSLFATLTSAVLVALWTATAKGRVFSIALPVLAVAALVPPVWKDDLNTSTPQRLAFFSDQYYKVCIPRGENLLVFPFQRFGNTTLWQAEAGFWFKLTDGTLGHNNQPSSFVSDPTVFSLIMHSDDPSTRPKMDELKKLIARRHVDRVVSAGGDLGDYPSGDEMKAFGLVQVLGNASVAPACGHDSLAGDKRPPPTG
jgi:hypothetical protein